MLYSCGRGVSMYVCMYVCMYQMCLDYVVLLGGCGQLCHSPIHPPYNQQRREIARSKACHPP